MNEELKIKVVLDQSDFKRQISTLKSSLKAAGETSKQTSTQGAQEATKSVGKTIAASLPVVGSLIKPGVRKIVKEVQNTLNGVDLLRPVKKNTQRLFKPWLKHLGKQYAKAWNDLQDAEYAKDTNPFEWLDDELKRDVDKAQAEFDKIKDKFHDFYVFAKDFEHSVNNIKNKIIEMGRTLKGAILPLIAVATALYKVTKATAELGNQIAINSQKFNMNTNEFQKWALYAEYCGSSMEELSEAFRQFSDKIYQAVNGASTAQEAFSRMNISLTDENGALKENSVLFNEVIDKLRNETNTTERSAKAQALFGDATQKLNLILNTEAGQIDRVERVQKALGAQMSGNLIAASNQLKDSLTSLKQAFAGLRNSLGESLMPVVQKVVVWLTVLIAKVNILVRAIFGLKDSGPAYFGKAASGATAYAGAVGKATGALQKLKLQTMGFDEMNILEGPDNSGSGDVGAGIADSLSGLADGGLMSSLLPDDALEKIEAFAEKVAAIKDQIQGYAFIITNVGGLMLIVMGLITGHPLMVAAGATLLGLSLNMGDGGTGGLAAALEDIASKVPAWVTTISLVAGILMVVVGLCTGNFALLAAGVTLSLSSAGISGANGTWSWIANGIDGIMSKVPGWMAVGSLIVGLIMMIVGICTGALPLAIMGATMAGFGFGAGLANGTWEWLVNKIKGVWDSIKSWFSRVVAPVFTQQWWNTHLWNPVGEFFSNVFNKIKEKVSTLWSVVKLYWQQNISPIFTQQWWNNHLWQPIGDFFTSMGNKIRGKVSEVWTIVKLFWQQQIAPKFTAAFWKNKFENIKLGARDAFNGLIGIVERGINLVVEKLNKLSFNIPDWIPGVGGNSFGISLKPVSIPRLATGGIATKSTLANIGEAGKEAILPLDSNTEWMDKLADRIVSRSNSTVVLEVDGRQLGKATVQSINNITKTTGRVPLVMA